MRSDVAPPLAPFHYASKPSCREPFRDCSSRRAKSPEVIEGGGARRGSERGERDQANGRGPLAEPIAGASRGRRSRTEALATCYGAGRTRTADLEFRKLLLYPPELRPRGSKILARFIRGHRPKHAQGIASKELAQSLWDQEFAACEVSGCSALVRKLAAPAAHRAPGGRDKRRVRRRSPTTCAASGISRRKSGGSARTFFKSALASHDGVLEGKETALRTSGACRLQAGTENVRWVSISIYEGVHEEVVRENSDREVAPASRSECRLAL